MANSVRYTIPLRVSITLGEPSFALGAPQAEPAAAAAFGEQLPAAQEARARFDRASLAAGRFTWQTALSLALASRLAYQSRWEVRRTAINSWGLASCEFVEADDTQCFVAASAVAVLVAFRGSESVGDWLGNLNALSTSRPYGAVHRGFLAAFQVVEARLRTVLDHLGRRPVLVTGHSLGGALATVAAAEWQRRVPIAWVYTFGQPAVGKGNFTRFFARHYADKFIRFVNANDIVARVPPTYRHVGRLMHLDDKGRLEGRESARSTTEAAASPAESPMLTEAEFDQLRAQLLARRAQSRAAGRESLEAVELEGLFSGFKDHKLDNYIAKIAANA